MSKQNLNHLYNAFEPFLRHDPKATHVELIELYYKGITHLKTNFKEKTKEYKATAMYFLKLQYKKGLNGETPENILNNFFNLYENKFETFRNSFELISDEDYLLLSFAYRNAYSGLLLTLTK
jgi:hypothetical protein